jgi:hypothetical protein
MYENIFNRKRNAFLLWKRKAHLQTLVLKEKCLILTRTLSK